MSQSGNSSNSHTLDIGIKQFYGISQKPLSVCSSKDAFYSKPLPSRLNGLFGPTKIWKVFQKQNDALEFAKTKGNGLMTFVFQQWNGTRLFLVAHPRIFWHYNVQKTPDRRCSYEIIPESSACKLYFDVEFDVKHNPEKNGGMVVEVLISVILYFLHTIFGIDASRENVMDLESSTGNKFSRHLIFQLKSIVFCNNRNVGEFVRFIATKLKLYFTSFFDDNQPYLCRCCHSDQLKDSGCVSFINVSRHSLQDLFVYDRNWNKVLVWDESVYSRNRHFRLFQNTKFGKNSHLQLSNENLYKPAIAIYSKNVNEEILLEELFLDSLITNFRVQRVNSEDVTVLNFKNPMLQEVDFQDRPRPIVFNASQHLSVNTVKEFGQNDISHFPQVDSFISALVFPGRIWRTAYFNSSNSIVYDIVGNRYCDNIKRQHKSNNVKYIVNMNSFTYYQKCYDPDCSLFRSKFCELPEQIKVNIEDGCSSTLDYRPSESFTNNIDDFVSDADLIEVADLMEDLATIDTMDI